MVTLSCEDGEKHIIHNKKKIHETELCEDFKLEFFLKINVIIIKQNE